MATKKQPKSELEIIDPRVKLPSVPDAFQRHEYEGWIAEKIKRAQLKTYSKTQAERVTVLAQINQIQSQCLAIAKNENNWRHLGQEDQIRQARLDIEQLELEMRKEDLQERRRDRRQRIVIEMPPPPDPVKEIIDRLRNKLRTGAEARSACDELKAEHPDYANEIEREFRKLLADLREQI